MNISVANGPRRNTPFTWTSGTETHHHARTSAIPIRWKTWSLSHCLKTITTAHSTAQVALSQQHTSSAERSYALLTSRSEDLYPTRAPSSEKICLFAAPATLSWAWRCFELGQPRLQCPATATSLNGDLLFLRMKTTGLCD